MRTATPPRSKRYTPPTSAARASGRPGDRRADTAAAGPRGGRRADTAAAGPRGGRRADAGEAHGARRVAAAVVDALLVPIVALGGAELAWWAGVLRAVGVTDAGWNSWSRSYPLVAWTVVAAAVAYHATCGAAWGRTAGKAVAGLAIVTDAGRRPSLLRSVWRAGWSAAIYAPTPLAPAVVVAGWMSVSGPRHRSLADRAAGTRVVRAAAADPSRELGRRR